MKQWLTMMIQSWLSSKNEPTDEEKEKEEKKKEPHPPCPICGEEWFEGDIFCFLCGYEERDEEFTLHPPPERTGIITDPDGYLGEAAAMSLSDNFREKFGGDNIDAGILVLTKDVSDKIVKTHSTLKAESVDGFAHSLYNTWMMGREHGAKGTLLVIDPYTGDLALVTGREGPEVSGKEFREWAASATGDIVVGSN